MAMLKFMLLFVIFHLNRGFLLDGNSLENSSFPGLQGQYLTLDDKLKLEKDIIGLKTDQARALNTLAVQLQQKLLELDKRIESVSNQNATCENLLMDNNALKKQVRSLENRTQTLESKLLTIQNRTVELEFERLSKRKIVAVTAGAESGLYHALEIILFTDFKTAIGITDMTDFMSSGKFRCVYPGLYLFSFTLVSKTDTAAYNVYRNENIVNGLHLGHLTSLYREVTGVFVFQLQIGEVVYVKCKSPQQQYLYDQSMVTIVKLD